MATGHILPGYGNPVTRLRRAQSAYPMDNKKLHELTAKHVPDMDPRTLDHIRQNARNMWLRPRYEPTTYNTFHAGDQLDEPIESIPTEPLRRHKPHPKPVFLINRLHYVPGYHNPDTTMGKPVYKIDDTFSDEERQLRRHQREKYVARPRTPAVDQYTEPWAQLTDAVGPVEAWGAQAWLKVADEDHQHEVVNAIRDYKDKELFNISRSSKVPIEGVKVEEHANVENNVEDINIKANNQSKADHIEHQKTASKPDINVQPGHGNQKFLNTLAQRFASANIGERTQTKDDDVEALQRTGQTSDKKCHTNGILQKKKSTFPLKVSTSVKKGVKTLDKSEIDKIICHINNKVYRGDNKNNDTLTAQQKVSFKSPVQIFRPNSAYVNKYRGNESEVKSKTTSERSKEDSDQSSPQPDNSSMVLNSQVIHLVARWINPMLLDISEVPLRLTVIIFRSANLTIIQCLRDH
ncbi:uncharacterized protein LOC132752199 isoform X2 [Ruditapes philippinarum]|uniref:uncharacterized protein LOC132752199 isoform X2 n=1 Tax=Ruditapes philippinarum TaxID=129788 RepID=UPI00295BE6F5|nr:uncharacterized protein LOC132752199 isoform X2 [Ruditapes philippinarum]